MSGANGSLQGFNLYAYCFNNPINMTDNQGNWPTWNEFWNEAKRIVVGVFEAYIKALEYKVGIGQGLGVDLEDFGATAYRDTYIAFDDGEFVAGNTITVSGGISVLGVSYEANHETYAGGENLITSARNTDGPLDMLNYVETEKATVISVLIFDFNLANKEISAALNASAHLGFGVHYSVGFNCSEFIREVLSIWR